MNTIFLKLLEMSLAAGWLVLIVIALRFLFQKAPKALICALWVLVAVRLLCPFSLEGAWSLMPKYTVSPAYTETESAPAVDTVPGTSPTMSPPVTGTPPETVTPPPVDNTVQTETQRNGTSHIDGWFIAGCVWLIGACAMMLYMAISTLRLRKTVKAAIPIDKRVFLCDAVDTPFILGVVRPKIYVPSVLSEEEQMFVLSHERAHLRRGDHIIKPFAFLLLSVYWFHPLMWVAYILLCRDIEMACDERVICQMDGAEKAQYSETLLHCSVPRRAVTACPLAFGESAVKTRIRAIVNYKKPAFWIILTAVIALIVTAIFFLVDPMKDADKTPPEPMAISSQSHVPYYYAWLVNLYTAEESSGYVVADINDDEQAELIIGDRDTGEITALYTRHEGVNVQLYQKDHLDNCTVYAGGMIKREWKKNTSIHGWDYAKLTQDESVLTERIVCDPEYASSLGEYVTANNAYYRSDTTRPTDYQAITYEEAMHIVEEFDRTNAPLTFEFLPRRADMVVDGDELVDVQCSYFFDPQNVIETESSKAKELYLQLLSKPLQNVDTNETAEEQSFVCLGFTVDGVPCTYRIYEDDALIFVGPTDMPMHWNGALPEGTYREVLSNLPGVSFEDMTGDGEEEVVVSEDLGGQGGNGSIAVIIYTSSEDGLTPLFKTGNSHDHGFESATVDNGFTIRNVHADYEESFAYTSEGEIFFDDTPFGAEICDTDNDNIWELHMKYYAYMNYRANHIGYGIAVWRYNNGAFRLTEAVFVPKV